MRRIQALRNDEKTVREMLQIGVRCFGEKYAGGQLLRNWSTSDPRSVFLGIFDGERLIAFNGFLAHLRDNGRLLFQSCHSAADPEFRGQGLFSQLIEHAKETLPGDYIVGFPNNQSWPILVKRLGFQSEGMRRIWLPCLFPVTVRDEELCRIDQRQVAQWKAREHPGEISQHQFAGNFLWGRIAERRIGPVKFRFFDAGGCEISNTHSFARTLKEAESELGVRAVRLFATDSSPLSAAAKIKSREAARLIWHPLHGAKATRFDIFRGMADFA